MLILAVSAPGLGGQAEGGCEAQTQAGPVPAAPCPQLALASLCLGLLLTPGKAGVLQGTGSFLHLPCSLTEGPSEGTSSPLHRDLVTLSFGAGSPEDKDRLGELRRGCSTPTSPSSASPLHPGTLRVLPWRNMFAMNLLTLALGTTWTVCHSSQGKEGQMPSGLSLGLGSASCLCFKVMGFCHWNNWQRY